MNIHINSLLTYANITNDITYTCVLACVENLYFIIFSCYYFLVYLYLQLESVFNLKKDITFIFFMFTILYDSYVIIKLIYCT